MNDFIYPQYNGKSLLNIPSTILKHFAVKPLKKILAGNLSELSGCEKIVLFLADGLGDDIFKSRAANKGFFKKIIERGFYRTITSVFPSTTASALSTINSGLSPLEHGLPEWNVYFRQVDCVIQTLPFLPLLLDDLPKLAKAPEGMLFNQKTIYQYLAEKGIPSYCLVYKSYADSVYNRSSLTASHVIPYNSLADFSIKIRELLSKPGKAYIFAYYAPVDTAAHIFGPGSVEVDAEIAMLGFMLESELVNKLPQDKAEKVAMFLTADHGQIKTNIRETVFLDEITGFDKLLDVSPNNKLISPSGSSRDVFLHVKKDKLNQAKKLLSKALKDKATVIFTADLINKGVFGKGKMHGEFLSRIGNLLILARGDNAFWYHFTPDTRIKFQGKHGGLSASEMLIPLGCFKIKSLQK